MVGKINFSKDFAKISRTKVSAIKNTVQKRYF